MEIFIGDRLEEFRLNTNGLVNRKGSQSPIELDTGNKRIGENASSVFKLDDVEGSIFLHCLFEEETKVMNDQSILDFNHGINELVLQNSIDFLINKYSRMRSNFLFDRFSIPVKRVYYKMPFSYTSLKYNWMEKEERDYQVQLFLKEDKNQVFDFNTAPLMSMSLIQTGEKNFKFVWTCHELLLVDTCMTDLMGELWTIYESLSADYQI